MLNIIYNKEIYYDWWRERWKIQNWYLYLYDGKKKRQPNAKVTFNQWLRRIGKPYELTDYNISVKDVVMHVLNDLILPWHICGISP